ncbi:MAG TPA: LacI family DNA-binding transcriptional regulator [Gemmatimonadaceae bacterium]|nr:LacI family DNA-binding transcriptional regulator [Gemmatimonadaceae bacterium]
MQPPNPPAPRATAHDVAARAGVSQPTVSLVLSGNPKARVSAETRARVMRAAEELGYRPNVLAQGLVRRRSYALGVVVPDLGNPFFAAVVSGAEKVASREGYAVFLCETGDTPIEQHLEALKSRQIDGVILDAVGAAALSTAALAGMNVVLVDESLDAYPAVVSDAEQAGDLAGRHLLSLGHRRLAYLGPAIDASAFRLRERGFVRAVRAAGGPIESDAWRRVPPTVAGGLQGMRALLALRTRPTAVFCANDLVALGALKACAMARVSVPRELSIVGCDDIELAQLVTPELTTIAIPARELGARAARLLIRQLSGRFPDVATGDTSGGPRVGRPLPVRLVVRGTTAAIPEAA